MPKSYHKDIVKSVTGLIDLCYSSDDGEWYFMVHPDMKISQSFENREKAMNALIRAKMDGNASYAIEWDK